MLSQIREKYEADQQVQLSRTKISLINSQIIDKVDTSELKAMMGKRQEILDQEDKLLLSIEQCLKEWNTNIKFVVQNEEQIFQMNKEIENHQTKIMLSKFLIKTFQLKQENIVQHKKSTKIQQQIKADAKKGIEEYGIISDHVKDQQKQIKGWRQQIQQQRNKIISQYPVMIYNDLIQRIPKNYDQKNDPCGIIETFENIKLEFQECIKLAQAWFDKDDACEIFQQQQKDEEQFKQMSKVTAETCKSQINFYAQQLQQLEIQQKILNQNFDQQQLLFKKELILYLKQEFKTLKSQQELEMVDSQLYYYEFIKSALNYSEQIKMNQIYQCSTQQQQITDTIQNYENRIHQLSQILKDSGQKLENSSIQALSIINNHQFDQWQRFNYQSLFDEVCQLIRQNQPQYDEQIEQLFQQLQEQYYKLQYQKEKQQEFQNEISLQRQQQRYVCLILQTNNQKIKKISNKLDELRDQQYSLNNRILNDQQQKVVFSQQLVQANELQKQIINGVKELTLKSKRAPYKLKDDKIYENLNKMTSELHTIECSINEAYIHKSINELMLKQYERAYKEPLNDAQLQQSPQKSLLLQKQDMKEIEKQIQQVRRNISKVRDFLISNIMSTKEKSLIKYIEILKEFLQFDFDYLVDDVRRNENIVKLNHQIKTATLKLQQSQTLLLIENSNMEKLTKFSEQALAIFNQSLTAQLNEVVGDIQNNQNLIQVEQQQIEAIKQKIYKQSQNRPMILKVFHKIYSHLDENCSQKIKQYHNEFEVINMEISQFLDKQQKIKQKRQQLKQKQQDSKQDYFDSKLEQSRIKCQLDLQEQAQNCNINIEEEVFQAVTKQIFDKYKRI